MMFKTISLKDLWNFISYVGAVCLFESQNELKFN